MNLIQDPIPITEHIWTEDTVQLVSISTLCYNHVNYIRDAIEGFLMQKTTFPVKIVIFDDCSTDGTQEILREYQDKYPHLFHITFAKENTYQKPTRREALKPRNKERSKGKYIALCEGDDYWTDPLKLQKQVDFLEENEDYILVCTNTENTTEILEEQEITVFDILHYNPIKTLTTVFRNVSLDKHKPKPRAMGDLQLWLFLAQFGRFYLLKDKTAYYRVLQNSASGRNDPEKRLNFIIDRIAITNDHIHQFNLSKKEKKKILQDQYSSLINKSMKKSKNLAFKYYLESLIKSRQINLLDLKILKNFL